jgi:XTP/dITP diphosphohydrolase
MSFHLEGRVVFFATNNVNKFNEARVVLAEYGVAVGMLRVKSLEIQSDSLEVIAKASVLDACGKCHLPILVEDAGLFVDALNGFPGPYAAYVYRTIGNEGLLQLTRKIENRTARFESAVAYCSAQQKRPLCFKGEVVGEIAEDATRSNANSGFGFDPIFKPAGDKKTFAEMPIAEKNMYSHRAKALRSFGEWYRTLSR